MVELWAVKLVFAKVSVRRVISHRKALKLGICEITILFFVRNRHSMQFLFKPGLHLSNQPYLNDIFLLRFEGNFFLLGGSLFWFFMFFFMQSCV